MAEEQQLGEILMAALLINKTFLESAKGGDTISKEEAVKLLRKEMGNKAKKDELETVFQTLDADGSGTLDFQEFLTLVGSTALMCRDMFNCPC